MKKLFLLASAALSAASALADGLPIEKFLYSGPYVVQAPVMLDSTDCNLKTFDPKSLLESATSLDAVRQGAAEWSGVELPGAPADAAYALHQLGFVVETPTFAKVKLSFDKAPQLYQLYFDGEKAKAGDLAVEPGTHHFVVKYLADAKAEHPDSLQLTYETTSPQVTVSASAAAGELYTIRRMMESRLFSGVSVSPKGDYLLVTEYQRAPRQNRFWYYLQQVSTGRRIQLPQRVSWMPHTNSYYFTRNGNEGREFVTVDPATGVETVLCRHMPEGSYTIAPTEDFLIIDVDQEEAKEKNPDVFEVVNPEDRQPGWRNRSTLAIFDMKTGTTRPLTYGYSRSWLCDISQDGQYALIGKNTDCYRHVDADTPRERPVRPHDENALYRVNLQTLAIDTLYSGEGFVSGGQFSPDGKQVLVQGTPEAFGRIGCTLPADVIPSAYDYQAFIIDAESHAVRPMTMSFDPTISTMTWSTADNMIYFTAENRDSVSLYRMAPESGAIKMLPVPEEMVRSFDVASAGTTLALCGQSAMNSDRLYTLDLSKVRTDKKTSRLLASFSLAEDLSAQNIADIRVADCRSWTFRNSNGDDVLCRYYLPVGFDPEQAKGDEKFPMITYYYGGCSPTGRNFENSYPWQCWAAQGYAVLVVQPSGAAGFGQEWASRHVNTAGTAPARDIMEAVREFCRTHAYINKDKVGCCGASYGGFMTQYMQTLPDCPFACAISHAGISDHTTYWGYGYWGYSYSEVSMANSFPWSETDLYVRNSPIYNVDKVTTPILFLHGTKDVNVPINNSIQMFTALKLLGRQTALVCVEGEDHGVVEYDKRMAWLKASLAWFQKYLKDDSSWWNELYPQKNL